MMGWGYGMGAGMWLSALLVVAITALVVVLVVRLAGRGDDAPGPATTRGTGRPTPAQILAERYARGEIGTAEYEERLSHLEP